MDSFIPTLDMNNVGSDNSAANLSQIPLSERKGTITKSNLISAGNTIIKKNKMPLSARVNPEYRQQQIKNIVGGKKNLYRDKMIVRIQLDKISEEAKKIYDSGVKAAKNVDNLQNEITNEQKLFDEINANLSKVIKDYENSKDRYNKLIKDRNSLLVRIHSIKNEIETNQADIEFANDCYNFMESLPKPDDVKKSTDYYKDTKQIEDYFINFEEKNKFLFDKVQTLKQQGSVNKKDLMRQIEEYNEKLREIEPVECNSYEYQEGDIKCPNQEELDWVSKLVGILYQRMFGQKTVLTPIEILTKVEAAMEDLYRQMAYVKPEYLARKFKELADYEKRLEAAKRREERERYIYEKKIATQIRSTREVKKPTGKKLNPRTYIPRIIKTKEEQEEDLLKQQQEDELLFGPIFD